MPDIREGMTIEGDEVPEGNRSSSENSRDSGSNRGLAKRIREELMGAQLGAFVADRYLQGKSMGAIAEELGITVKEVSRHVKDAIESWRQERNFKAAEFVLLELGHVDKVEVEAWDAFERSRGAGGNKAGDPRFLATAIQCSRDRRELLGLHGGVPDERNDEDLKAARERRWQQLIDTPIGQMLAGKVDPFADPHELGAEAAVLDADFKEADPDGGPPQLATDAGGAGSASPASPQGATPPAPSEPAPEVPEHWRSWRQGGSDDDDRRGPLERAAHR